MKHYWTIILLFVSLLCKASIYDAPAFTLQKNSTSKFSRLICDFKITNDTTIEIRYGYPISGLAISGKIMLLDKEAIVRVVLMDNNNNEFLVFEDFYMFPDVTEYDFYESAMETAMLNRVSPKEMRIYVLNAQIEISQITQTYNTDNKESLLSFAQKREKLLAEQENYQIERWNKLNAQTGQYWIAGKTSISSLPYAEKKIILGAKDDHYLSDGIEYYVGGFFVIKAHEENDLQDNDIDISMKNINIAYVDSFDWRNRHGKNWMTSVKHQAEPNNSSSGNGGCWIFGPVAALESHVNLYYNRLLNLDLSEQEIGSCVVADATGHPSLHSGGLPQDTYNYIQSNGIVNEQCFPFQNDSTIPCETICDTPLYTVDITSHSGSSYGTNQLKHELINNGPIASGFCNGHTCHVMCLCGYGTIYEGIHINYVPNTANPGIDTIIPANSDLIGKTYWIYKNSFGLAAGVNGYFYAVYEKDYTRGYTQSLAYPVSLSTLSTNDIVCEDADNDGYYFWGLGPKPDNCPICCPDIPDGDDSNSLLAEMDTYGNFSPYVFPYPSLIIDSDSTWSTNRTQCGSIIVTNNATLTLTADLTMNPAAKIIVQDGGTLIVDAGRVYNSTIDIQETGNLHLLHDAALYLKDFGCLKVRIGGEANLNYGKILLQ